MMRMDHFRWKHFWVLGSLALIPISLGSCSFGNRTAEEDESADSQYAAEESTEQAQAQTDAVPEETPKKSVEIEAKALADQAPSENQKAAQVASTSKRKTRRASRKGPSIAKQQDVVRKKDEPLRTAPFLANGTVLNAYYLVRDESSWVDVSQKLYRDPVRAQELKSWNPTVTLRPGEIVYYRSAMRPNDEVAMLPFYEDYGAAAENYPVQKGDTLAGLAAAKLGSPTYAAEVLAANPGLKADSKLSPGMTLRIPPMRVENQVKLETLARVQLEEQRKIRAEAEAAKSAAVAATTAAPSSAPAAPATESRAPASTEEQPEGLVAKIRAAAENLPVPLPVIIGSAAILAGGAFLVRRRRMAG